MSIMEDIHYYTNSYNVKDRMLRIDRVYLFDEDAFTESDRELLGSIYASLPQYRRSGGNDVPYWFGREGTDRIYLWVSAEPPGFRIAGELPLSEFLKWEIQFHALIGELPFRRI